MKEGYVERKIMFSRPEHGIRADRTGAPLSVLVERGGQFVYSRGHHDAKAFCEKAEAITGMYYDFGTVQYRWVRLMPASFFSKRERRMIGNANWVMKDTQPNAKGSFPITCCEASFIQ